MRCPSCHRNIPDTAVRCRFCRRSLRPTEGKGRNNPAGAFAEKAKAVLSAALFSGRDRALSPWSFVDVAVVTALVIFFAAKDPLRIGLEVMKFLRLHFFIFTKEPKLLYYLAISINTIIFKIVVTAFILISVKLRGLGFWRTLVFCGKFPASWKGWLFLYAVLCCFFRIVSMSNPLVPNIPFNSVFPEALLAGNVVIIFSILFVAPFVEEIAFRGFLYPALNRYMGIYPAIILTSALFTLAHFPQIRDDFLFIAIIFGLSLVITYARARTGSTWLAVIMHGVYNLMYILVGFANFLIVKY